MNYAVIFAGGVGSRMGSSVPKQFLEVDGKPILIHTIEKYNSCEEIDGILLACKEEYITYSKNLLSYYNIDKIIGVISGGISGQETIYLGLKYLIEHVSTKPERDIVLIHDGVRPVFDHDLIQRSIDCVQKKGNSIAVARAVETVITVDEYGNIETIIDRSKCRNAKAPQCFYLMDIWNVHNRARKENKLDMIDCATMMSTYGCRLYTTECSQENIKITTPNDYYMFKGMFEAKQNGEEF